MRVVLFAPTNRSLYSRLVARGLGQLDGVELVGIYVRRLWSRKRIRVDLRRHVAERPGMALHLRLEQ